MSRKLNIIRIDAEGNEVRFFDLKEAAQSIQTKLENWKVQLFIADAINNGKSAFKYHWIKENK